MLNTLIAIFAAYALFGAGFYIGLALNNPDSFLEASAVSLIRGLLIGFIFWPIGLVVKLFEVLLTEF